MRAIQQILDTADTTGDEFYVDEEKCFILLTDHNGGEWKLQIKNPDDDWKDIADDSGGVSYDSDGIQVFYAQPWLAYRLNGGNAGAKAWRLSAMPAPGFDADAATS